jgi:dolichol-phosphate mannosyltransferase
MERQASSPPVPETLPVRLARALRLDRLAMPRVAELVRFSIVGSSGIVVNLGLYALLTRVFDASLHVASPIAIEASIVWCFSLNDSWTFRDRRTLTSLGGRLARFHVVSGIGGVFNYAVLVVLVEAFGLWDILANLLGIGLAVLVKFAVNSVWTWREAA